MGNRELQCREKDSDLGTFIPNFNHQNSSIDQEDYFMDLGVTTQRQWRYSMACPTDKQLSWLGR